MDLFKKFMACVFAGHIDHTIDTRKVAVYLYAYLNNDFKIERYGFPPEGGLKFFTNLLKICVLQNTDDIVTEIWNNLETDEKYNWEHNPQAIPELFEFYWKFADFGYKHEMLRIVHTSAYCCRYCQFLKTLSYDG